MTALDKDFVPPLVIAAIFIAGVAFVIHIYNKSNAAEAAQPEE